MSFEEFQDNLLYWNRTVLAILNLYVVPMPPIVSAQSDMVLEETSLEEFHYGCHGGHLGYQNRTILAILNLYVTVMPPIKFRLNRTYTLEGDII